MVKPVYLQDNFSKAPLAQIYQDLENEGAERLRDLYRQQTMKEQDRKATEQSTELEEKAGTAGVHPDGSPSGKGGRQKRGFNKRKSAQQQTEEAENDLRFRKPEDDQGKGDKLDLEG